MKIDLTKEQYRTLILLTSLGECMVNSHRETGLDEGVSELLHHILAYHKDFDAADLVDPVPDDGKFHGSTKLNEWAYSFSDAYDDESFWDELSNRLAERDFSREYSEEATQKMKPLEHLQKIDDLASAYDDEFCAKGLENLVIRPSPTDATVHPIKPREN